MLRLGPSQGDLLTLLRSACHISAALAQRITSNSTWHPSPAARFSFSTAGMPHLAISGGTQTTHGRTSATPGRQQQLSNQRQAPASGPPRQQRRRTLHLDQPTHNLHRTPGGTLLPPQHQELQQVRKQQQVAGGASIPATPQQQSKQDSPCAAPRRMWSQRLPRVSAHSPAQAPQHFQQLQQSQQLQQGSHAQQQQPPGSYSAAQADDTLQLEQQQQAVHPPSPYHLVRLRQWRRQQHFLARFTQLPPSAAAPNASSNSAASTAAAAAPAAAAESAHSGPLTLRQQHDQRVQQPVLRQGQQCRQQQQHGHPPGPFAVGGPVMRTRHKSFGHMAPAAPAVAQTPQGVRLALPGAQQQQQQIHQQQMQRQAGASIPWHSFGVGRSRFIVAALAAVPAAGNPAEPTATNSSSHMVPTAAGTSSAADACSPGRISSSSTRGSSSSSSGGASGPRLRSTALFRAAAGGQQVLASQHDWSYQQQQGQQQQQQQALHLPAWHTYADRGPFNFLRHVQHQQQQVPQELLQPPPSPVPAVVDITHLLDMQLQEDASETAAASWSSSRQQQAGSDDSGSSMSKRQQQLLERQQRILESCYGQEQQLLWVSVHQPAGGNSPAAVWVQPWACALSPDRVRFSEGRSGQVSVLLELPQRPHLGHLPAAVVDGLAFSPTAAAVPAGAAANSSSGSSSSSSNGSSSSGGDGVHDFLLLSSGDFSALEYENMFPNALVHCGDGRQLHSARGAHDLAAFVAEAELWRVRDHCDNLIRCAWDKDGVRDGAAWVNEKLQQRWGAAALVRLGVGPAFIKEALYRVMGHPPPVGLVQGAALWRRLQQWVQGGQQQQQ